MPNEVKYALSYKSKKSMHNHILMLITHRFNTLVDDLRKEWHQGFYNTTSATYGSGEQTALGLALYLHVVPDDLLPQIKAQLVHDIMVTNKGHQTAGIIGTLYMFEALSTVVDR